MLLLLLSQLSWTDRARCALVCKEWRDQVRNPSLWTKLDLRNSQEPQPLLRKLPRIPYLKGALKEVDLEFAVGVEDEDIAHLAGFDLTSINFNGCQRISSGGVTRLVSSCHCLHTLLLYWNLKVDDRVLHALGNNCPQLTTLSLSGCKHVTDEGILALARGCPLLVDVDLTRCLLLTESSFKALATHAPGVEVLRLYACVQVADSGLKEISRLAKLRVIDICGTQQVTDTGVQALARCHDLEWVNFTWCTNIGDAGMVQLAKGCCHLKWLSLHGLLKVTDVTVSALAEKCRETLSTLDVNGCRNIQKRSKPELLSLLPRLTCFRVHS